MRVGFVLKRDSTEAEAILRALEPRLHAEGHTIVVLPGKEKLIPDARAVAEAELANEVDLLVVLGGDGTFLWGATLVADRGVPILGVNVGSLGFITAFSREEAMAAALGAARGELPIEERMRLEVKVHLHSGECVTRYALNDCVLSQGALARLVDLEAFLDGTRITTYKADGLIIATPTGSTAYNLAAGGPILTPDLQAIVLTPICPHTLTNRPLVAPGDSSVEIRVGEDAKNVVITIDGQRGNELVAGDRIVVRRGGRAVRMFRSPSRGHFDILRQKLRWGERAP